METCVEKNFHFSEKINHICEQSCHLPKNHISKQGFHVSKKSLLLKNEVAI